MQGYPSWSIGRVAGPAILALLSLPAGLCLAQQEPAPDPGAPSPGTRVTVVGGPARTSQYWLGVVSEPVPEALRAQLSLRENEGLLVEDVAPNSPAAAAKIQRYDIVLKAGGKALARVDDLIAALDAAKGQKLSLEILRKGARITMEIIPAKRPDGEVSTLVRPGGPEPWEAMRKWLERMRPGEAQGRDFNFYYVRPGVVVGRPGAPAEMPENLTISITRQGNKPLKIVVTRGDQKWEIGENELDKLPADIRPYVERMLRHSVFGLLGPRMEGWLTPPATPTPLPPAAKPGARAEKRAAARAPSEPPKPIDKQLEELSRRLDEVRKAVDELKQNQFKLPAVREAIPPPRLEPPKSGANGK